jgi:predicted nuclease of predicted toxin-antitoxin system
MRVLIDECLPKRLKLELPEHTVSMVQEVGWSTKKNGELLRAADGQFDALITADQNLEHQQNLRQFSLAVVVLVAPDNRFLTLQPLMPKVRAALQIIQPREIVYIRN